jgi:hypothetical protein
LEAWWEVANAVVSAFVWDDASGGAWDVASDEWVSELAPWCDDGVGQVL